MDIGDVPPSQLSDWGFVPIPRVPETSPSRADVHGDSHRFASQWRLGAGGHGMNKAHAICNLITFLGAKHSNLYCLISAENKLIQ